MIFIGLSAGRVDYNRSWDASITLLGFSLFFSRRLGFAGWKIGFHMEWPKWKWWTLYEWLPKKRLDGDNRSLK